MAALIHEGTGAGQGHEHEQVSELAMRSARSPLEAQAASDGLAANQGAVSTAPSASAPVIERVYRHRLPVRISHWLNVPCLLILIMSGLQIFNAHPALYWGDRSDRDQAWLSIRPMKTESGEIRGITTILGYKFDTTGVLGYSDGSGRAFPAWATVPSYKFLGMGRQWHLFFAWLLVINGLFFTAYALISRHFTLDLTPTGKDLRGIGKAVKDHIVLRHPTGHDTKGYNVLQKLAYVAILFVVAPLIILTGLAMSPTIDAAFPWLLTVFGGRQGARTIHFIACFSFVGFIVIHVVQVMLTGFFNNMRAMVTGWFVVKREHEGAGHEA